MAESTTSSNLFNLLDNAISALKKADLVQEIISLRGKVILNSNLRNLCDQISNLSENITKLATTNQQINSELAVAKVVNSKLEKRVIDLEKKEAKSEQYSRGNIVEFTNVPNDTPHNHLERKVIQICRESGVEVDHNDIEGCHRLPVSRHSRSDNKRMIVRFFSRKHLDTLLYKKKSLSSEDFSNINIPSKTFMSLSFCLYY